MSEPHFPSFTDVACHLFLDFRYADTSPAVALPAMTLGELATANLRLIDPSWLGAASARSIADKPVWETRSLALSNDLHPFIRTMLDGADLPGEADRTASTLPIHCLGLSPYGKNLIAGRYCTPQADAASPEDAERGKRAGKTARQGLEVVLSPSARNRLAAAYGEAARIETVPVALDDILLFGFRTGISVAVSELSFPTTSTALDGAPEAILEAFHPLCREIGGNGPLRWRGAAEKETFFLTDLVRSVLGQVMPEDAGAPRLYSYVAAVFETAMPQAQARELAFRLSRRYTGAYRIGAAPEGTVFTEPFEDVIHAASLEGASSIVNGYAAAQAGEREFLKSWLTHRRREVYLPLQIVAAHERAALFDLAQNAALDLEPAASSTDTARLQELCRHFLAFRLRYRYTQVSHITMHNQVHQATRAALGLDRMIEKIAHDVVEVERWLTELAREEEAAREKEILEAEKRRREEEQGRHEEEAARTKKWEQRYAWFAGLGGVGLAFLTVTAAAKAIAEFLHKSHDPETYGSTEVLILGIGLVLAICLAAVGFWYGFRRQRSGHPELGHQSEHAGQKAILKGND